MSLPVAIKVLSGTLLFPVLADLYGRRPALIWSILAYAVFTGLSGFSTGWVTLLIFSSITRIGLAGENPVGMLMVTETAPTKWRATALGGLVGGYPLGYMLCSLAALVVVPLWGWRSLTAKRNERSCAGWTADHRISPPRGCQR